VSIWPMTKNETEYLGLSLD